MADDPKLSTALRQAKSQPMYFTFIANGAEGKLLVNKKKISPKDVNAAKAECGGGKVYRGRCTWTTDNVLECQVAKAAPAAVHTLTKKIIKRDAGLMLDVLYRVTADAELDDEADKTTNEAAPPAAPPMPPTNQANFVARLKPLQALLAKVEVTNPAAATQAREQIALANKAFLAGKHDDANAALDRVTTTLKQSAKPGTDGVAVAKRFLALATDYQAAVTRLGPNAAPLQALHEKTRKLVTERNFAQAAVALDLLEKKVVEVKATPTANGSGKARVGWQAARVEAVSKLRKLETLIAKTKHPLAGETVTLIEGVIKRLPAEIKTKQHALDLTQYLSTDAEVSDLEGTVLGGVTYSIRPPLVKALAALQEQLPV